MLTAESDILKWSDRFHGNMDRLRHQAQINTKHWLLLIKLFGFHVDWYRLNCDSFVYLHSPFIQKSLWSYFIVNDDLTMKISIKKIISLLEHVVGSHNETKFTTFNNKDLYTANCLSFSVTKFCTTFSCNFLPNLFILDINFQ